VKSISGIGFLSTTALEMWPSMMAVGCAGCAKVRMDFVLLIAQGPVYFRTEELSVSFSTCVVAGKGQEPKGGVYEAKSV
jgi:hypothetical protein